MKKLFISICLAAVLTGCAGRPAHPVATRQPGDYQLTCQELNAELSDIKENINIRLPKTNKTGKNVALGIAGAFIWPAWLFMDLTDSERVEVEAYRSRYSHLTTLFNQAECSKIIQEVPSSQVVITATAS